MMVNPSHPTPVLSELTAPPVSVNPDYPCRVSEARVPRVKRTWAPFFKCQPSVS